MFSRCRNAPVCPPPPAIFLAFKAAVLTMTKRGPMGRQLRTSSDDRLARRAQLWDDAGSARAEASIRQAGQLYLALDSATVRRMNDQAHRTIMAGQSQAGRQVSQQHTEAGAGLHQLNRDVFSSNPQSI